MTSIRRLNLLLGSMIVALLMLLVFVIAVSTLAADETSPDRELTTATVQLNVASNERLSFTLNTPPSAFSLTGGNLNVSGLTDQIAAPGLPSLPYYSTYIVVPPDSSPRFSIQNAQPMTKSGMQLPLSPVELVETAPLLGDNTPPAGLTLDPTGGQGAEIVADADAAALAPSALPAGYFPSEFVQLSEPMMFRDVPLVRVTVFPIQYDANQGLLSITSEISVTIDFRNRVAPGPIQLLPSYDNQHISTVAALVLNPEQIEAFRGLPEPLAHEAVQDTGTALPLGIELYKIAVVEDGIHELSYDALSVAGLDVDAVNPATLEMMYRGEPVATNFVGDGDDAFEPGESLQFYGQVFAGSRLERQYINENIYWLWAGGQALRMGSTPSVVGQPVTSYLASLTTEPETVYFQGFTNYWPENEPDAWYWARWNLAQTPVTRTFTVTLPGPAIPETSAQYIAEFSSRDSHISDESHHLTLAMNSDPSIVSKSWWGESNFNVSASVPSSNVLDGPNHFKVTAVTDGVWATLALNRITVNYQRSLRAIEDQLTFSDQPIGARQYQIQGFSQSQKQELLAWEITNPYSPTIVLSSSLTVDGNGPYTVTYGFDNPGDSHYIVTTSDNILEPASIRTYVAPQLDPPAGADWVAIAHKDFLTETRRLADHRTEGQFGGLSTHVIDIEDIVNQYGYGLPVPAAIQNYLLHAFSDWPVKPTYVVLVGDTTLDPRRIKDDWTDKEFVLTDLVFVDRYNGHIPSDLRFALLSGSDILPDLSVGRLAVEEVDQLALVIDKIILFDETQLLSFGWMENMLYVADKYDAAAGDFCLQQQQMSDLLPPSMNPEVLCLDDYSAYGPQSGEMLRNDMVSRLEDTGVTMLAYRGHGSANYWGGNPIIYANSFLGELTNQRPFVTISGDCLDGHFAYPPAEGLGELLVSHPAPPQDIHGAAAHWGSSGLGIATDHTAILHGFYDAVFGAGITALGPAINHAKLLYNQDPWRDEALIYSFNLQGDPAMHLMKPDVDLSGGWQDSQIKPGRQITLTLSLQNHGVYPSHISLVGEDIDDFVVSDITSTVPHSTTMVGDGIEIALQFGDEPYSGGIPRGGTATISVTYDVAPNAVLGSRIARFMAKADGEDAWPGNETITDSILVLKDSVWLPTVRQ